MHIGKHLIENTCNLKIIIVKYKQTFEEYKIKNIETNIKPLERNI